MRINLLQENLNKGVSLVSRMVASKAQLPVLSNILMTTEQNKLRLSATNLETGVNLWLSSKVDKAGKITVPARIFSELVSSLPQGTVGIEMKEDNLRIVCEKHRATVNGISAEEFPEIPSLKGKGRPKELMEIKSKVLKESVAAVAVAAGVDEARPIFTGVKMEIGKSQIRMAATDGYRLSVKTIKGLKGVKEAKEMVVPAKALMELVKILGQEGDGEVLLAPADEEKQLILAVKDVEIVTRLLEGDFPDFEKIIPESSSTTVELDTEELSQAVKAAAIFARDSANIVKFGVKSSVLKISANAPQVGENEVEVSVKQTGEDAEIAFNSRYLIEMLSVLSAERLSLSLSGPLSPGVFRVPGDDSFLHIIMPVRVQS